MGVLTWKTSNTRQPRKNSIDDLFKSGQQF